MITHSALQRIVDVAHHNYCSAQIDYSRAVPRLDNELLSPLRGSSCMQSATRVAVASWLL
jgi:hypothetical protein